LPMELVRARRNQIPSRQYTAEIPIPVNEALIARGQERYGIACVTCHGALLNGKGPVASYFKPAPASFYAPYLKDAPDGYIFEVITHGKGQMYPQAQTLSVEDRWAIIAYIRSLENNPPAELSQNDRSPTDYPPTFRVPGTVQPNQPELPGR
jgi:mono/diheme cytochrome c family protein